MRTRSLVVALVAGLAAGSMLPAPAAARPDPDASTGGLPYVEREEPSAKAQREDLREAGERACREAFESAARLGEQLHDLKRALSRNLVQLSGELTRSMAQGMDDLADRLHELSRRMERPSE